MHFKLKEIIITVHYKGKIMASDRRDPLSETTPAKRMKLGQDEEIHFGYRRLKMYM